MATNAYNRINGGRIHEQKCVVCVVEKVNEYLCNNTFYNQKYRVYDSTNNINEKIRG